MPVQLVLEGAEMVVRWGALHVADAADLLVQGTVKDVQVVGGNVMAVVVMFAQVVVDQVVKGHAAMPVWEAAALAVLEGARMDV